MQEKYEKPELLSQKMEINVLRAGCINKTANQIQNANELCNLQGDPNCDSCSVYDPDQQHTFS